MRWLSCGILVGFAFAIITMERPIAVGIEKFGRVEIGAVPGRSSAFAWEDRLPSNKNCDEVCLGKNLKPVQTGVNAIGKPYMLCAAPVLKGGTGLRPGFNTPDVDKCAVFSGAVAAGGETISEFKCLCAL